MDDYKEIFKRELDRLNYLYAKANTKSKKVKIAFDLIFFETMCSKFSDEIVKFAWEDDEVVIDERIKLAKGLVKNVLDNQNVLLKMVNNAFNVFYDEEFSTYMDYGKCFHKISEELMQEYMVDFYTEMDPSLVDRFISKFDNMELFVHDNLGDYSGLTYPFDSIDKNIILFSAGKYMTIDDMRILAHEMGHDFEFDNSKKAGVDTAWNKIARTFFVEVSSSFFEYAVINYLIDNRIYFDDALMLKRKYLNQVLCYLIYILVIYKIGSLDIDYEFMVKIDNEEVVDYANSLLDRMNLNETIFQVGDKIEFRSAFIYGIGKLLGIYAYESYKANPQEFLSNFRKTLIEYKNIGMEAFQYIDLDEETIVSGNILRKVLRDSK